MFASFYSIASITIGRRRCRRSDQIEHRCQRWHEVDVKWPACTVAGAISCFPNTPNCQAIADWAGRRREHPPRCAVMGPTRRLPCEPSCSGSVSRVRF
jgi:hypothetical protein